MPVLPPLGRFAVSSLLFALLAMGAGCQHAIFTGAEPSARSFYEDPDFNQTFIGVDLNFELADPPPHVPAATHAALLR